MSNNETLSNKVGNATHGAVGDETLLHQTQHLASASLDYAKGLVGLGKDAGAKDATDAKEGKHGAESSHTLGGLVEEGRNLAANVIHETAAVIGAGQEKAKEAVDDKQLEGYVAKARGLAAGALGTIESYVAAGEKQAKEAGDDLKQKADEAADALNKKVEESKSGAADAKTSAEGYAAAVKQNVDESSAQLGSDLQKHTA
ncbi:hypothetical protein JCM10207_005135 [Rhodosporidiobolus poonsookiae]